MEMSVYSHKANDRFRRDKISILEQLGICISKEKEAEIYNKVSEEEIDAYARKFINIDWDLWERGVINQSKKGGLSWRISTLCYQKR